MYRRLWALFGALWFVAACGTTTPQTQSDPAATPASGEEASSGTSATPDTSVQEIEIAGMWDSNFGGTETISSTKWDFGTIVKFDNEANFAITQNPPDDAFSPDKFNRLVWTEIDNGSFYYCWVDFGFDSAALALASTNTADSSDLDNSGCGGFAWTKLTKADATP